MRLRLDRSTNQAHGFAITGFGPMVQRRAFIVALCFCYADAWLGGSLGAPQRRLTRARGGVRMMAGKEITMPALSSTMTEGKVTSWMKGVGDFIEVGEAVMVVESDKADMDVESFEEGFLAAILVGEDETADVGAPVALLAATKDEIAAVAVRLRGRARRGRPLVRAHVQRSRWRSLSFARSPQFRFRVQLRVAPPWRACATGGVFWGWRARERRPN